MHLLEIYTNRIKIYAKLQISAQKRYRWWPHQQSIYLGNIIMQQPLILRLCHEGSSKLKKTSVSVLKQHGQNVCWHYQCSTWWVTDGTSRQTDGKTPDRGFSHSVMSMADIINTIFANYMVTYEQWTITDNKRWMHRQVKIDAAVIPDVTVSRADVVQLPSSLTAVHWYSPLWLADTFTNCTEPRNAPYTNCLCLASYFGYKHDTG